MFIQLTSAEESNQQLLIRVEDISGVYSTDAENSKLRMKETSGWAKHLSIKESVDEIHKRIRESQNGFPY